MAFLLSKTFSRSSSQNNIGESSSLRRFHVEPGPREIALLKPDPALKRYKSYTKSVYRLKRVGEVLTIVVAAGSQKYYWFFSGCCYEIYVKATMREEARKQARAASEAA
ncbi:hypothetical protein IFM89_026281 [Coptis chinensis]|uniref:Uncharacterized protein n=1 Tax=Coptis chinensis TaxID=261450 RepID=A0A835IYC7_9MAGN|nr:hypothetical protein IFM89_026281 [Coptis chinensis]